KRVANAAIANRRKKTNKDPLHIVYAGRIIAYQKRIYDYAKVSRSLLTAGVNFKLTLLGDGPDYDQLRDNVTDLIDAGIIRLAGRVSSDEIKTTLGSADVFLLL